MSWLSFKNCAEATDLLAAIETKMPALRRGRVATSKCIWARNLSVIAEEKICTRTSPKGTATRISE
jgi:hypothetical protein